MFDVLGRHSTFAFRLIFAVLRVISLWLFTLDCGTLVTRREVLCKAYL